MGFIDMLSVRLFTIAVMYFVAVTPFVARAQDVGNPEAAAPCAFDEFQEQYSLSNIIAYGYPNITAKFGSKVKCAIGLRVNSKCLRTFLARAEALAQLEGAKIYSIPGLSESESYKYRYDGLQIVWMVEKGIIIDSRLEDSHGKQSNDVANEISNLKKISERLCGLSRMSDNDFEKYVKPTMRRY